MIPPNDTNRAIGMGWIYTLKRRMIIGLLGLVVLTTVASTVFIALEMRSRLLKDSAESTRELGNVLASSLRILMLKRDPGAIQQALTDLGGRQGEIVRVMLLHRSGRIAFSTNREDIGRVLDRFQEPSCVECHHDVSKPPRQKAALVNLDGADVQRIVHIIYNEPVCHACHSAEDRINGKLIIDRSMASTRTLIASLEMIIGVTGALCLALFIPFLVRQVNRYISEILNKSREIDLLVTIANRLSRTIDVKELRAITVDVVGTIFNADEVIIVHPKNPAEQHLFRWERSTNKLVRARLDTDTALRTCVDDWIGNRLVRERISADRHELCLPIVKGVSDLALVLVRSLGQPLDEERLRFIGPVSNHLAIAFENAQLYTIAITDELTHLYSLRHFHYCMDREIAQFEDYDQPVALIVVDIDNFKRVNDTYGHATGDTVLKQTGRAILDAIRGNDLAFRYGGEELVVILPSTDADKAMMVAERVRERIEAMHFGDGEQSLRITASIGVASCPEHASTSSKLFSAADTALYAAKRSGKNRVVKSGAA